jgi:hypothetical protein
MEIVRNEVTNDRNNGKCMICKDIQICSGMSSPVWDLVAR